MSDKKVTKVTKPKKSKDISSETHDNSFTINMHLDNLSEKDLNKLIKTFDNVQKDYDKNIREYYIKQSSNKIMQKGKSGASSGLKLF